MELGNYILEEIKNLYPADLPGTGHTNETPFVFVKFTSDIYKVGYKGILQLWIVGKEEVDVKNILNNIQEHLNLRSFTEWYIQRIEYTKPIINHLTDDRWLQEITATIIYEEV